ncbi:MAG: hypothetical protein H6709_00965 [Kofleriaceae bacterium]|nr:hypothetical protein [Myxococcales bacterium]MCB9558807.1 hypothetical protein [Kofleriaceae bacterium]MCB9570638.1 hypothetical protein [Kofleriaceae bacterium]
MRALVASLTFVLSTAAVAACGGGSSQLTQVDIQPTPEPVTIGALSGPLCTDQACQCRDPRAPADGGAGVPELDGVKRFEIRVGPSEHALWVKLDDWVLYKSDERATDCFYVDLKPGKHPVTLRAHQQGGFSAKITISEYGAATQSWYDTYAFDCGSGGGVCDEDDFDAYKASLAQYTRGLHDPCGSTKVKGVVWDTGRAPDFVHPEDLQLELTLEVYQFAPQYAHGDAACRDRYAE